MSFAIGDRVRVRDPDGAAWRGVIVVPSVLFRRWWVVQREPPRPRRGQRAGKAASKHVHESEMRDDRRSDAMLKSG